MRYGLSVSFILLCAFAAKAGEADVKSWPLWNGRESTAGYAQRVNLPPTKTLDLGNGVKLEMVLIPAGEFMMGTPKPEPPVETGFHKKILAGQVLLAAYCGVLLVMIGFVIVRAIRLHRRPQYSLGYFMVMMFMASVGVLGGTHWWYWRQAYRATQAEYEAAQARYAEISNDEKPALRITLTHPFYMGKFPVTQEQYQTVMDTGFCNLKSEVFPVVSVTWNEAQEFCKQIRETLKLAVYLPTEAEWEYACRAGTITKYYSGDSEEDLQRVAWYSANSNNLVHPAGQKEPNGFGLYDMHGNVWQWCQNWYGSYAANTDVDPEGPRQGAGRVLRGGSCSFGPLNCRSASRAGGLPSRRGPGIGFRVMVPAARTP